MADINVSTQAGSSKSVKAPRKRRGGLLNLLLLIGIIVTISLFVWAEQQRREAQQKLGQTAQELEQLRQSAQTSGQEVANQVLEKLRKHMDIPTDPQPTVATIVDVEALKQSNEFYKKAANGDHLIITEKRAILYDSDRDVILDVVPISIDQNQQAGASTSPTPAASATPTSQSTGTPNPAQASPTSNNQSTSTPRPS